MLASFNTYKLPSSAISFIGCLKIQRTFTTKSAKILRKEHKVLLCSLFSLCSFVRTSCALWLKTFLRQSYLKSKQFRHASRVTGHGSQVMQRNWFDPWGNPRDTTLADFPITNRGFTGHEHYNFFKIINMNGRLYDPVIGRFFSPDNFVQLPEFTQSFNRYSYCLNNPLTFVDPTGQLFSPYYDHDGKFLGLDEKGWSGNIYITTEDAFKASATGGVANSAIIQKNSATKLISQFGGLSDEALAMIYTSILSETGYADLSKLHNGSISVFNGRGGYNDPISNVGRAEANRAGGRINVTVNSNVKSEFNTVESVQSFLGVHEYKGHGIKGYDGNFRPGNKHYMSYMLQFQDKSFNALSDFHKQQIVERTFHHMFYENRSLYNTYESGNSKLFQLYRMYRGQ